MPNRVHIRAKFRVHTWTPDQSLNKNPNINSNWKNGRELHFFRRNKYWKNPDVADASCCSELYHGVSRRILRRFRKQHYCPRHKFSWKRCAVSRVAFGFAGHVVFSIMVAMVAVVTWSVTSPCNCLMYHGVAQLWLSLSCDGAVVVVWCNEDNFNWICSGAMAIDAGDLATLQPLGR